MAALKPCKTSCNILLGHSKSSATAEGRRMMRVMVCESAGVRLLDVNIGGRFGENFVWHYKTQQTMTNDKDCGVVGRITFRLRAETKDRGVSKL